GAATDPHLSRDLRLDHALARPQVPEQDGLAQGLVGVTAQRPELRRLRKEARRGERLTPATRFPCSGRFFNVVDHPPLTYEDYALPDRGHHDGPYPLHCAPICCNIPEPAAFCNLLTAHSFQTIVLSITELSHAAGMRLAVPGAPERREACDALNRARGTRST